MSAWRASMVRLGENSRLLMPTSSYLPGARTTVSPGRADFRTSLMLRGLAGMGPARAPHAASMAARPRVASIRWNIRVSTRRPPARAGPVRAVMYSKIYGRRAAQGLAHEDGVGRQARHRHAHQHDLAGAHHH